ncbi:YggS family pyridoxal phosphate-dependent enzyme [Mycobacterium avium subsp. hominissuis]|uniref:Pyridoxal phosphate homeostasis protein n=2 Tax=Mycobacterium TaxID=1763 RepID=A0AA37V8G6_9MYCO|nr:MULTISPECIES: YggS family pyridoxal phosphate-dependent enzyme [Mycobacterium]ATO65253.2 YggS family pyridoxal phosphate-dependent enzyme [Mycobacterium avium subsp. hominissuis]ATO69834.1 YggS family pyridoxal phosphate-dependent enzyme [Mycobacterium avium subsp. hominissuis]ATO74279.1 YggS family pyridoxal phosphate-dependent enzyme [Mycobacterium avium subsp. hominissuis]MBZ4501620.1 YggS family pyridoxal phosphate-dependent enzyme [Mycobacterium avium subsp. hominissuis]MBZ4519602.1 Yg
MTAGTPAPDSAGDRETELTHALAAVRSRLAAAAEAAGRNVAEIEVLPVTKFFPATDVVTLSRLGCRAVGESRDQEATAKVAEVTRLLAASARTNVAIPRWHMVGHIQRNKARSVARWAHTAHSVDSTHLVSALDRGVAAALADGGRTDPMRVYVQVSLDGDESRGGVDISRPGAVDEVCAQVAAANNLDLIGLMAIPPLNSDPDEAFDRLQSEHRRVLETHRNAVGLSAGMSDDFEIAVKHGSTCVRVGTALLGRRPLPSP